MGLFKKNKKVQNQPMTVKKSDPSPSGYVIEQHDKYVIVEKNGNEIFDGDVIATSPSGAFSLVEGYKNNKEALALISNRDFIASKNCENGVDVCAVFDNGVAVVATDDEKLIRFSPDGCLIKSIGFAAETYLSAFYPDACVLCDDDGETVTIKCFNFMTGKTWTKHFERDPEITSFSCVISREGYIICISATPDILIRYDLDGKVIK